MANQRFSDLSLRLSHWRATRVANKHTDKEQMDKSHRVVLGAFTVVFILYSLSIVFPFLWLIFNSLKTKQEFLHNPWQMMDAVKLTNYIEVFQLFNLGEMLLSSLSLCLSIPTANLFVTACVAYAVAKFRFFGRRALYFVAVAIMFIPTTGSLAILYRLMNDIQLWDTLPGMVLMSAGGFGFNFLIMHGIFSNISATYSEAAKVDGAGYWRTFIQIIMPQASTTMFAIWILGFIGCWNDYATPYLFYPSNPTLAVGLKTVSDNITIAGDYVLDYPKLFAAVIITVIPVIILFAMCQKFIIRLSLGGGIKG